VPAPAPAPESAPESVRTPRRAATTRRRPPRTPRPPARRQRAGNLWATLQVWGERARARIPGVGPRGVGGIALLAAIVASSLAGGGAGGAPSAARADAAQSAFVTRPSGAQLTPAGAAASRTRVCPQTVATAGYANPLAGAAVKPERVDQGVDYAGSGTLVAIGAGKVTYLGTTNTGWPGAFIEFQLLSGADAGCYVYYAEGVVPAAGLAVGQTLLAGQPVATIIPKYPSGIELGWGSGRGTKAFAKVAGQWSPTDDQDNVASAAGQSFSALIAALGGPPGKVEG